MARYNDIPDISSKFKEIDRRLLAMETAPRLTSSSIGEGGIKSEDFNGSGPTDPGTSGWAIGSENGSGYAIFNSLILRDNIIGEQALANAFRVVTDTASGSAFAIPSAMTDVAAGGLVVPPGFTKCGIIAIGTCNAVRSTSGPAITFSPENIGMRIKVDSFIGQGFNYNPVGYGDVGNLTTSFAPSLTGLTDGQVIPFSLQMSANPAMDLDFSQFALINIMAVFTQ